MGKFTGTKNAATKQSRTTSPVATQTAATTTTYEGGQAWVRTPKSELFVLAASNFVGEDTFYEQAGDRDKRFQQLVHQVAADDPHWIAGFVPYLRNVLNLRSAAVVMAAEYAIARPTRTNLAAPPVRAVVSSAMSRPDEPAEFLAYWEQRTGTSNPPAGVKRGVADAVQRLYSERNALKYDGTGNTWRLGDVINRVHPEPKAPWQADLFAYLLDRRHHPKEIRASLDRLPMIAARVALDELEKTQGRDAVRRRLLKDGDAIRGAGLTWEVLSSYGAMDKAAWEAVIPSMGYAALLRNLRNFDAAGVSDKVADQVIAKLTDPDEVARSRQLPIRFYSAYKNAPSLRWGRALEKALDLTLVNVPSLPGRTLILVDRSGSMWSRLSARSEVLNADAAAIFGTALTLRAERANLVQFGTSSSEIKLPKGASLLPVVTRSFSQLGGTNTAAAVKNHFNNHDRVVIVTDEQAAYHYDSPQSVVPQGVPVYTWNLVGYRQAMGPSGSGNRHTFAGLSDAAFALIPLIEQSQSQTWPWES